MHGTIGNRYSAGLHENAVGDEQYGFRKGRWREAQINTWRRKPLFIAFMNLEKGHDRVNQSAIDKVLHMCEIHCR